jgi:TRAP-type C4-dicarboxylate transport system permease large subunit
VISAKLLSMMLIYQSIPSRMLSMLDTLGASAFAVVIMLCILYLLMGMFFDGVSMMVMTIPFVVPIMSTLHVDLVWLGIVIVLIIEIGLLTPPVGLNLYVLQGATNEPIRDVIIGSLPFLGILAVMVLLLFVFPQLALFLPGALF